MFAASIYFLKTTYYFVNEHRKEYPLFCKSSCRLTTYIKKTNKNHSLKICCCVNSHNTLACYVLQKKITSHGIYGRIPN